MRHGAAVRCGNARTCARARRRDRASCAARFPARGGEPVLAFRDYGHDIASRLLAAGFAQAWIEPAAAGTAPAPRGFARPVRLRAALKVEFRWKRQQWQE